MALSTLPTPALLALALGLSMDAVAVALMTGLSAPQVRTRHALLLAGLFGFFQGVMPAVGWLFGAYFQRIIGGWDHWVAFAILAGLGAKMIRDAWLAEPTPPRPKSDAFALTTLLALAVATSLDALAAGFTLPLVGSTPLVSVACIALVTFVLSLAGVMVGRRCGAHWGPRLDFIGGAVLIGIGAKIALQP